MSLDHWPLSPRERVWERKEGEMYFSYEGRFQRMGREALRSNLPTRNLSHE